MFNNKKVALLIAALITTCEFASAQVATSDSFERQRKAPMAEKDTILLAEPKVMFRALTSPKYQMFDVQFTDWNPDSLHWNAPSNMIIGSDGSWFIYAKHLANMRRLGGIFDSGATYNALVNVTFYNGPLNAQNQCTGTVVHSQDYHFYSLNYKQEIDNATARGVDNNIANVASQVKCGSFGRGWR